MSLAVHRPEWPEQPGQLEKIEQAFRLYLQHVPYADYTDSGVTRPGIARQCDVSVPTAKRLVARAKALVAGGYTRDLMSLSEVAIALRHVMQAEAWDEIRRIEDDASTSRRDKTGAKRSMLDVISREQDVVDELLGLRKQDSVVSSTRQTLVVIGGSTSADRVVAMGQILEQSRHVPATEERIREVLEGVGVRERDDSASSEVLEER